MGIEIHTIDQSRGGDLKLKNQPFSVFGRMIVKFDGEQWSHSVEHFQRRSEMCFPDEDYSYDETARLGFAVGAYDGDECVALAIMRDAMLKYMYLYDLKVNAAYRRQGVGKRLIEKSAELAKARGYRGIYTVGQDNNLAACGFYLKSGFVIGGLDTLVYRGSRQENKRDIYFYLDAQ